MPRFYGKAQLMETRNSAPSNEINLRRITCGQRRERYKTTIITDHTDQKTLPISHVVNVAVLVIMSSDFQKYLR